MVSVGDLQLGSQSVSQFSEVSESDLVGVEEKQQFLHKVDKHETRWSNTRSSVRKHTRASETGC